MLVSLQQLQDLIPFFLCLEGDFTAALDSLFPAVSAPASRLSPSLFLTYLCVFDTAKAPKLVASYPQHICSPDATWEPIKGQTHTHVPDSDRGLHLFPMFLYTAVLSSLQTPSHWGVTSWSGSLSRLRGTALQSSVM